MAQLDQEKKDILLSFKDDLRKGKLDRIANKLTKEYLYDRGYIIAYMLEKGVDILSAMEYIPRYGIIDYTLNVLIIPGNIKSIKSGGISNNRMQEIIIEDGVERIEGNAIASNPSLEKISLPESLMSIGPNAFSGNTSLKEVFIPDSITVLPKGIFSGCNDVVIYANYREDKRNRLKCVESERDFYRNHLKWIRGE